MSIVMMSVMYERFALMLSKQFDRAIRFTMIAGGDMQFNVINVVFLQHMVEHMYRFEAKLYTMDRLLNEEEIQDFYGCFMSGGYL